MHRGSPAAIAGSARSARRSASPGSARTATAVPSAVSSTIRFSGGRSARVTASTASSCARSRACSWTGLRAYSWIFRKTTLARVAAAFVVFIGETSRVSSILPLTQSLRLQSPTDCGTATRGHMTELKVVSPAEERGRFFLYCGKCHAELYEAVRHVTDYREDPVSRVYEEFYSEESRRTCGRCGHITPRPAG